MAAAKEDAMSTRVVGGDGTKGGWIAVTLDSGRFVRVEFCVTVADLVDRNTEARVIALDIPIGELQEAPRPADAAARQFLRGRASSVFSTPVYAALTAHDYAEARAISLELTGKSLSKQSWELRGKILEATKAAGADERIIEVHPEVTFVALNEGRPLPRKRSYNGVATRQALLRAAGVEPPAMIEAGDTAPIDDVLDAAAAAWSEERKRRGEARSLPEEGAEFAIWY